MRKEEIQHLKLMEEVLKDDGFTTQRELAKRLDVSVGLVNAFIKRVVRKGYFKVTTIPGRRVRYLLTPKGFAEKSRLTISYLRYSISYYQEIRNKLRSLATVLREKGVHSVALIGTGELAELFCLSMQEVGIEITAVVSTNGPGVPFLGYSVVEPSILKNIDFDVVCLMELVAFEEIYERLREVGIPKDKIFSGADL